MKTSRRNVLTTVLAALSATILPRRLSAVPVNEGWIPIEQELPPLNERVLLTIKCGQSSSPSFITLDARRQWREDELDYIVAGDGHLPAIYPWHWDSCWGKSEVLAWRRDVQAFIPTA